MKNLLALIIICGASIQLFAQDQKLQLAFVATPQLSWMSSDNTHADYSGLRLGYSLGLQSDMYFAKNYAFSASILYSKLGGKIEYTSPTPFQMTIGGSAETISEGQEILYNLSYIEIPLGLKLKTKEFRRNIFWGQVGVSPMINIASVNKQKNSLSEETGLFNLGYHYGIGTDFSLGGSTYITGALMLTNGLLDITTNDTFKDKATLHAVNLRIGVIF